MARAAFVAATVVMMGQGVTPSLGSDAGSAGAVTRVQPSVRNDRSAPVSSLAPVTNRKPPTPDGDSGDAAAPDGLPSRLPSAQLTGTDPALQSSPGTARDITQGVSFRGIGDDGYMPPDPNGDVGPNDYVQVVNDAFAVYDKRGDVLLRPEPVSSLWQGFGGLCENQGQGDPVVLYDPLADRFVISQFAFRYGGAPDYQPVGPYDECIAVTRTGDPTGAWYRYAFPISQTKMDDYPKLGVWPDGYYMTVNQFGAGGSWGGVGVVAFDRSAMLEGHPASLVYLDDPDPDASAMLPADLDGWNAPPAGSPEYLVALDGSNWGTGLDMYRFHVNWSNPSASTFAGPLRIPTAAYDANLCNYNRDCIPQPDGTPGLDANSSRLMYRLAYRNLGDHQSLVVNQTVDANGNDRAGVRWYEIRNPDGTPSVYQQGTYAPDAQNRFLGSVAMDQRGDIGLGYSVSSTSTYPSIRYTGRLASDPLGTLPQAEGTIKAGGGPQVSISHRWGDYSSMSVDPSDDCTFWYTSEYYGFGSGGWSTRIGSFRFAGCGPSGPTLSIDDVPAPEGGTAAFTVSLSKSVPKTVTVDYATQPGTAGQDDFQATSGTLTFDPGQTTQQVSVPVTKDGGPERKETFSVVLSNPVNAPIRKVRGTATIPGDARGAARPDGMIRLPSTPYRGHHIFNTTGWRQTEKTRLLPGRIKRFFVGIRNTGKVKAAFRVHGPGNSRGFAVAYRFHGRLVTRRVVAGTLSVVVPAGRERVLQLEVQVRRRAHPGHKRAFLVMATSTRGGVLRDAVKARVRVRRLP